MSAGKRACRPRSHSCDGRERYTGGLMSPPLNTTCVEGGRHRSRRAHAALVAAWSLFLVVLLVFAVAAFVRAPPGFDSSVFLYVATGLLEGERPYLDRWDHKPPLIFLVNAVGLLLSDVWGIWVVQAVFLVGACLAAWMLVKPVFGTVAALFAVTVLLVYSARLAQGGGNHAEPYALVLQFAALALFAAAEEKGKPRRRVLALLGALGAAAFMLRPNLVGVWLAIGIHWLAYRHDAARPIDAARRHVAARRIGAARKLGWAAIGGLAVFLGFVVWLVLAGGLASLVAFWDAAIVYNVYYSDAPLLHRLVALRLGFEHLHPVVWLAVLGWSIGVWRMLAAAQDSGGPLVQCAVILLPIELVLATGISGYVFQHYYLTLVPVASVLSAFVVGQLLDACGKRLPWLAVGLFAATASIWMISLPMLRGDQISNRPERIVHQSRAVPAMPRRGRCLGVLVEQIELLSEAGDPILIWGKRAWPYLAADRRAPTRYLYAHWLMRGNRREERIDEFTGDVIANPPALIVDLHSPDIPPLRATNALARSQWRPNSGRLVYDTESFRAFFEFTDSNYALAKTIGSCDIYRKINGLPRIHPPIGSSAGADGNPSFS